MTRSILGRAARLSIALLVPVVGALTQVDPAAADQIRDGQWHLQFLNIAEVHKHSQGQGVKVAVLDSGVDGSHRDLTGAVAQGIDLTASGRGRDGRTDISGHGTAMAGLIAAHGHGTRDGVLGIAPRAVVLPVRVHAVSYANGHTAEGITWAIRNGARVICIALAGDPSADEQAAIEAARQADVVVVAGVGNTPDHSRVMAPAVYPGVIAAAGVDQQGNHAGVSVTGPEVVLSAPAVDIVSTDPDNGYAIGTGTSNATAIIAGAAALVRAKYPNLTAEQVIHRLTATATDKGPPGRDDQYGYGVLDIVKALTADLPAAPTSPTPTRPSVQPPAAAPPADHTSPPTGLLVGGVAVLGLLAGTVVWHRRRGRR